MSKKSLDDLFRDAFDAPTEAPSNALWQRLEKRLDERRAERRKARRIRFLQPGVVILTVALLLLAGLAGWYFVKNHRAKISPKPLIYRELGWLEGTWGGTAEGKKFSTKWDWKNDSTLASGGFVFDENPKIALVPNQFFQRGDSLFYMENGEVFFVKNENSDPLPSLFFKNTNPLDSQFLRIVRAEKDIFDWFEEDGKIRHDAHFFRKK